MEGEGVPCPRPGVASAGPGAPRRTSAQHRWIPVAAAGPRVLPCGGLCGPVPDGAAARPDRPWPHQQAASSLRSGGGRGGAPTHGALLHLSKSSCARRAPRAAWRVATPSVRLHVPRPARAKARNARRAPSFQHSGSRALRWVSRRRWPWCPNGLYRTSVRKSSSCPRGGPAVAALCRSVLPGSNNPTHAAAGADPLLTGGHARTTSAASSGP